MTEYSRELGQKITREFWDFPEKKVLVGESISLVPLSSDHTDGLWRVASVARDSFLYSQYGPFEKPADLKKLLSDLSGREDQPFWAVINDQGNPVGWLSICDVYQSNGCFEIGSIWFAPELQGTKASREAIFLLMCLGMDELQYERLVWRCQAQNQKSVRAAENLEFVHEGTWRNAAVVDGWQRGIAWFSILKNEWPRCRDALRQWLCAENFDAAGLQIQRLQDFRKSLQ